MQQVFQIFFLKKNSFCQSTEDIALRHERRKNSKGRRHDDIDRNEKERAITVLAEILKCECVFVLKNTHNEKERTIAVLAEVLNSECPRAFAR